MFGEEIAFDDLIQEHEKKYGKLRVYHGENRDHDQYVSSESEKELYKKITLRIEHRLEDLTRKVVISDKQR
jgi:hypothetical protein